jgi:hypothetical protein
MAGVADLERLLSKIERNSSGCWLWKGTLNKRWGYGYFSISGKPHRAHRASYELLVGPIPDGLWVLHKCDVRKCVNPDHLFLGTREDNTQDMVAKNRQSRQRGDQSPRAKLTWDDVRAIRAEYGKKTLKQLGALHSLWHSNIRSIVMNETWCDPSYTPPKPKGVRKLTPEAIPLIKQDIALGELTREQIARRHGVSRAAIRKIAIGETWKGL